MGIWISWNIDISRNLNSHDSFPRRKFENRAPTCCRAGSTLSPSTVSFELHAKVAEKIDLEMCTYRQFSQVKMLRDFDLNLGSGQGHINIHSTCRTTSVPNHVTVASRTTEIWPFECREMSIFGEVWTLVIAFLEGNSKIWIRQAVVQVVYYHHQPSFELHTKTAEEIDLEKCNFRNFVSSVTLTLTLDRVESHCCAYLIEVYPHTKLDRNRKRKLCGRTDGRTHLSSSLLGHRLAMT